LSFVGGNNPSGPEIYEHEVRRREIVNILFVILIYVYLIQTLSHHEKFHRAQSKVI
jgi:hypothetical protein